MTIDEIGFPHHPGREACYRYRRAIARRVCLLNQAHPQANQTCHLML